MDNNLFILTNSFPFEGGEQFLETEINFWKDSQFDNIYIIPDQSKGEARPYPNNIKVLKKDHNLSLYILITLFKPLFYKELIKLFKEEGAIKCIKKSKEAFKCAVFINRRTKILGDLIIPFTKNNTITVYSYWNDTNYYAACRLKKQGYVDYLISRAHGYDIYAERRPYSYMPFKRKYADFSDLTFLLSNSALNYYKSTYQTSRSNLQISKLGVNIPDRFFPASPDSEAIKILTLSSCIPLKQIDLIMSSIALYASLNSNKRIEWNHIGNGPLYEKLKSKAVSVMNQYKNLKIDFIGNLPNHAVKNHLDNNYYDFIINASTSEGVPVSLMEAMSYGIPAIAPDIGGISELVNEYNGYLMPSNCSEIDIIAGIDTIINNQHPINQRKNARVWIQENYNSEVNYPALIHKIESVAECKTN